MHGDRPQHHRNSTAGSRAREVIASFRQDPLRRVSYCVSSPYQNQRGGVTVQGPLCGRNSGQAQTKVRYHQPLRHSDYTALTKALAGLQRPSNPGLFF